MFFVQSPVAATINIGRGAIIELDATEADEVKILANNLPVASGMVLVDRNPIKRVVNYQPLLALPSLSLRFKLEQASPVRVAARSVLGTMV